VRVIPLEGSGDVHVLHRPSVLAHSLLLDCAFAGGELLRQVPELPHCVLAAGAMIAAADVALICAGL